MGVVPFLHPWIGRPAFVILWIPALEDHAVDAAGTSKNLPPALVDSPTVHVRFRFGFINPVVEPVTNRN